MGKTPTSRLACALFVMVVLGPGCSDDATPRPECIELLAECSLLYVPTFQNLFEKTLAPKCGDAKACHSAEGRSGGLAFADPDEAFDLLRGNGTTKARVRPNDPQCSELVVRTHSPGEDWSMPPGHPLPENEQCVIRQWIEQGAER